MGEQAKNHEEEKKLQSSRAGAVADPPRNVSTTQRGTENLKSEREVEFEF